MGERPGTLPQGCQPFCVTACCCSAEMNPSGSGLECPGTLGSAACKVGWLPTRSFAHRSGLWMDRTTGLEASG